MTLIDNQSWISIHVYVMEGWKWLDQFFWLQQVVEGSHVDNLIKVIVESLFLYGNLSKSNLVLELVYFGVDNVRRY